MFFSLILGSVKNNGRGGRERIFFFSVLFPYLYSWPAEALQQDVSTL